MIFKYNLFSRLFSLGRPGTKSHRPDEICALLRRLKHENLVINKTNPLPEFNLLGSFD